MAIDLGTGFVIDPKQPDAPPYRPFRERPSGVFIQMVAEHIKETGQPETIAGLYRGKIDRAANFRILRRIDIDRKKRPERDMAPCPRCGRDDKFLEGVLAWFPDLQFCAVIGHCCAAHEALTAAEKEFKAREKRDHEEMFLLAGLPRLAAKAIAFAQLRSPAEEATRIFRKFRKEMPEIHRHLRHLKAQQGGRLRLTEILRSAEDAEESDYVGPAGFRGRGRGQVETREIEFGTLDGQTAVLKDYNPVKELDGVLRVLDSFDVRPNDEQALDLIIEMTERERRAAVAILKEVDRGHAKFVAKLADFWQFFSLRNVERLHSYGTDRESPLHFEVKHRAGRGRVLVTFTHRRAECRLLFADKFASFAAEWPA